MEPAVPAFPVRSASKSCYLYRGRAALSAPEGPARFPDHDMPAPIPPFSPFTVWCFFVPCAFFFRDVFSHRFWTSKKNTYGHTERVIMNLSVSTLRLRFLCLLILVGLSGVRPLRAQTDPMIGIRENTPAVHAFVHARIVVRAGRVIEDGTLVIRDGKIEAVGASLAIPPDARVWDMRGKTIYPGLIESEVKIGPAPVRKGGGRSGGNEGPSSQKTATSPAHWNPRVHPQEQAVEWFNPKDKTYQTLRQMGFTTALLVPEKGIFRGQSVLVNLRRDDAEQAVLQNPVAQHLAFERAGFRESTYPSSLMGSIALVRQTLYDARWYAKVWQVFRRNPRSVKRPEFNPALEALQPVLDGRQPLVVEVEDDLTLLRAEKLLKEFDLPHALFRGSGYEYRQLDALKATGRGVILPVNFPQELEVTTPEEALNVSLVQLQHWELAPQNPARLAAAGIPFTLTGSGLKNRKDFPARVRQAIKAGLSPEAALRALTETPARLLGVGNLVGSLEPGKLANLVVTDGDLFDEDTQILDVWVDGIREVIHPEPLVEVRGRWQVTFQPAGRDTLRFSLSLKGKPSRLTGSLKHQQTTIRLTKASLQLQELTLVFPGDSMGWKGLIRLSGSATDSLIQGRGELPDGTPIGWAAERLAPYRPETKKAKKPGQKPLEPARLTLTPGAYGREHFPEQPTDVLVQGATLWTCGPQGILKNSDLLIHRGKIAAIGQHLEAPEGALVIEARGKHVTPGLIDAHSHTGISGGVNEGTHAVTAEVRIGDVVNSYDIDFYRELAGGLTVANQLHGSANPIGGQNAVVKLRWGASPEAMKVKDAPPGIKFALGENVKQSNWGDRFTTRYPQTRLGVEQIIRDRFKAALDYERRWEAYRRLSKKQKAHTAPPRLDLQLETLLEILHGRRLVHSHSYRQDEILMLIRVAEDFGFRIGTFQHVLEGYKIAEAIADHGAGASTFSDWWAYKFEVYDAIPYNGALMHRVGVVVSFNSDSDELARRLNTEAAKAVKYGGLSPEEALKFVTINPARQLGIDHRVGSLEVGKDADFVIWSGNPLSTYTICEQTWIDGRKYFDRKEDLEMRRKVRAERTRIIQKYLAQKNSAGHAGQSPRRHR